MNLVEVFFPHREPLNRAVLVNSGGPQAPLPILTNPCAERWLVPSREWIPSTDSREEFKQDIPRIYHSKNELEAHVTDHHPETNIFQMSNSLHLFKLVQICPSTLGRIRNSTSVSFL
ncbi:hypothetical protein MJO28_004116 [Puccinia striiformis f. sp. tritici]|uniref:Uncharacterized protein n=1 Tax=Puccinia striiformis f. sp. tritici TaxID=168172 RepID=A0ACC0ENP2_9BASI|nr:hypothetical protein MJO28_004116 [Puccinia striiformis f. sp. tritici]